MDDLEITHQAMISELAGFQTDREADEVYALLVRYMKVGGGMMAQEAKADFFSGCMEQLAPMPLDLILPPLKDLPLRVKYPSEVLPYVMERIEKVWDGRKRRLKDLEDVISKLRQAEAAEAASAPNP